MQGSLSALWLILLLENQETSLVRAAARDQADVQGLCRTSPAPHWLLHPESWSCLLHGEQGPYASNQAAQWSEPWWWWGGWVGDRVGEPPLRESMGELAPALLYLKVMWV